MPADPSWSQLGLIIAWLVLLEGLLSADNALVLALMVRHLPKPQQKRALKYGIWGAFIFRALGVLFASYLMRFIWFQLVGAAYLVGLAIKHFIFRPSGEYAARPGRMRGFWGTVVLVELTDIVFSLDSILAAVAMCNVMWVVYLGGILGIVAMRFVAGGFLKLLERFPGLEAAAYLLVGWIGLKLGWLATTELLAPMREEAFGHQYVAWVFWPGMFLIFFGGIFLGKKKKSPPVERPEELAPPGRPRGGNGGNYDPGRYPVPPPSGCSTDRHPGE